MATKTANMASWASTGTINSPGGTAYLQPTVRYDDAALTGFCCVGWSPPGNQSLTLTYPQMKISFATNGGSFGSAWTAESSGNSANAYLTSLTTTSKHYLTNLGNTSGITNPTNSYVHKWNFTSTTAVVQLKFEAAPRSFHGHSFTNDIGIVSEKDGKGWLWGLNTATYAIAGGPRVYDGGWKITIPYVYDGGWKQCIGYVYDNGWHMLG